MAPDPELALIATLRRGGAEAIAAVLRRVPVFAEAVRGRGAFALRRHWGVANPGPQPLRNVADLAAYLALETPTRLRILHADRNEYQLLVLAAIDGGMLDKAKTRKVLGLTGDRAGQARLDRAAHGLADLLLTDPDAGWVALAPGITEMVPLPGIPFRRGAEAINKEYLAIAVAHLRVTPAGTRKFELVDAIESALRDPDGVAAIVARLDPAARTMLRTIAERGTTSFEQLRVGYYRRSVPYGSNAPVTTPEATLHRLVEQGLVGIDPYDRTCWMWLDLELAARGGVLYPDWSVPTSTPAPLATAPGVALPPTSSRLDAIVEAFVTTPVKALKAGGLGVQSVRTIAKTQRRPVADVGLLSGIAIELGLVGLVVLEQRGRGRNITVDYGWQPDPERTEAWQTLPAWARYARIVEQWLDSTQLPVEGNTVERYEPRSKHSLSTLARRRFAELLRDLPVGTGLSLRELTAELGFRQPRWFTGDVVDQLVVEARVLGLVPADGPIGLTAVARQVLADAPGLAAALADSPTAFTVQGDHTIIAPPGLDSDLDATLARLAVLESDAGARIYRITDTSVGTALDSGMDADAILAFLHEYSTVAIAPNVERTVRDAADRHGRLQIGSALTWVACDDPVQLLRAVAVKAAKLTVVSPTAAVSSLPEDKVLAALRTKGVAPARADAANEPKARLRRRRDITDLGPRAVLLEDPSQADDLAKHIADAGVGSDPFAGGGGLEDRDWDETWDEA